MSKQYSLPKEFAERWVAALRSGEYNQGDGTLYNEDDDCYCCLGVGARICNVPTDKIKSYDIFDYNGGFKLFGIPDSLISGGENNLVDSLTSMNDGYKKEHKSFPEIADWICDNVEFTESEEVTNG